MKVTVEGWRHYSQSIALVNQQQCLALLKHPAVTLCHRDLPPPPPRMLRKSSGWQPEAVILGPTEDALVRSIPNPPMDDHPDLIYRIAFPYCFAGTRGTRTFIYAVTETGILAPILINGISLAEATRNQEVTIVTPSEFSRSGLLASGAAPEKVVVVPHGVNPAKFTPLPLSRRTALRKRLGWQDRFVFLAVGAMYPYKGIESLLTAFAVIAEKYPHSWLALKGSDNSYSSREALANLMKSVPEQVRRTIQHRMTYSGLSLTLSEMAELYNSADLLVAPYRAEGFNLPVIEAAACGLPIICTAGGPTDETTLESFALRIPSRKKPSPNASWGGSWLYPDQDALIAMMEKSLNDSRFMATARIDGPEHIASRYTWKLVAERLVELFSLPADAGNC